MIRCERARPDHVVRPGEYRLVTWASDESAHLDITVSGNVPSNTFTLR